MANTILIKSSQDAGDGATALKNASSPLKVAELAVNTNDITLWMGGDEDAGASATPGTEIAASSDAHWIGAEISLSSSESSDTMLLSASAIQSAITSAVQGEDTLTELNDTNITSPADGALLLYDTGTSTWRDATISGATLSDVGAFLLDDDAVATGMIANNAVRTAHIMAANVTLAKMADNSVDSDQYVDGSIDTAHIADSQITEAKMAANSVDSDSYVDGSIDLAHMSANSVDSDQYVDGSIDTAHLAADAVTSAKIADDTIDSEHYAAGSIDLEHMSSESVDEDNLYISNGGSNGQFLQKQSGNNGGLTWADGGVTVSDSNANENYPVVFHDESNVLHDDTGALRYNPSTGTLLAPNLTVAGTTTTVDTVTMNAANAVVFEGATADDYETTLTITDPTADRTITLPNISGTVITTGDTATVTATMLAADSVDSSELVDGSVDLAHMSANSVDSSQYVDGSIDLAHMSANSVDSDQYVDGSIDLAHMSANSVDSDQYVDGSIDTAHIANDQITNALMADDAIDSAQIADGAIDEAHMSANSIDSDSYVDGSIDLAHMSANSVDSDQYVDGSVDNVHLANSVITIAGDDTSLGGSITAATIAAAIDSETMTLTNTTIDGGAF